MITIPNACRISRILLVSATALAGFAAIAQTTAAARAAALVARMTLEEKVSQMQNHAPAIPRLNIPAYDWWSEGLHGIARSGYATVFPQAIGLAATFDSPGLHDAAVVISTEARAKNSEAQRHDNHDIYFGLDLWSPNINIFRDPRWGRGQETYGEDPFLTARMGVAFVTGLQGDDPKYLRVVATPKHFAVHSGPENTRHTVDVVASPHDLEDTYLPAFHAAIVDAHAASTMCAYNSLDGQPACANEMLLKDILRGAWKFSGYVTSDCAAITDIAVGHKFAPDLAHASVDAVRAGTDTSCGREYSSLTDAVHQRLIAESEVDQSVTRLFTARFRLGLFDPPTDVRYARIPFRENDSPAHRTLALKLAEESIVLLKNDGVLPLAKSAKTLAIIGPNAASLSAIEGNYNAVPSEPITPLLGIQRRFGKKSTILYAQGSPYVEGAIVPVPPDVVHPAMGDSRDGLKGEYFNNADLSGSPLSTRIDPQISFDWNSASPVSGLDAKAFSVRWTGVLALPAPGDYTFRFTLAHCYPCNDIESIAVWADGKQVNQYANEQKQSRSSTTPSFTLHIDDRKPHALRVEYVHRAPLFGAGISFDWQPNIVAEREQAVNAASKADVVIAFVGLTPELEGEEMPVKLEGFNGGDRTSISLPRVQEDMLKAVAATGKPIIVVLLNGSAISAAWAKEHAAAMLEAWYPGEEGGTAIAATLAGDNNPAGRLPVTFYASTDQLPAFDNYAMKGRTYRYFEGTPLFGFGYGLSYTHFTYSNLKLSTSSLHAGTSLTVDADVKNTGAFDGDEVAELYLTPPAVEGAPKLALEGFQRVHLRRGETKHVLFTLDPRQLSLVDEEGIRAVRPGQYQITIGGSQPTEASGVKVPLAISGTSPIAR